MAAAYQYNVKKFGCWNHWKSTFLSFFLLRFVRFSHSFLEGSRGRSPSSQTSLWAGKFLEEIREAHLKIFKREIPGNLLMSCWYSCCFFLFLPKKALLNISSCSQVSEFEIPSYNLEKNIWSILRWGAWRERLEIWWLLGTPWPIDACSSCV